MMGREADLHRADCLQSAGLARFASAMNQRSATARRSRQPPELLPESGRRSGQRLASFLGTAPASGDGWRPISYIGSAAAVALALGCGLLIRHYIGLQSILLVFLMPVLASAIAWGVLPSLFACLLSVVAFNFFLIPPLYTFRIEDPDNAVALSVYFVVAVIVSNLAAAARSQIVTARTRADAIAALFAFSGKLAGIGVLDDLSWAICYQVSSMLGAHSFLMIPPKGGGPLQIAGAYPPEDRLDDADRHAARLAWEGGAEFGAKAVAEGAKRLFLALRTDSGPVGVIGVVRDAEGQPISPEERRMLDALADQAAVAIERVSLAAVLEESRVLAETERLRAALLTSISHDLRTPLASILGAVSSLRSFPENYDPKQREELLATVQEEAERLNRFVANLLDMTRLESGAIELRLDLFDVGEVVGAALRRAADVLAHHRVVVDIPADFPMVRIDAVLFEQVLFNLLDNAAKFSPAGSRIDLRTRSDDAAAIIELCDEGTGIPPGEEALIFNKFHRVQAQDRRRAGTGLGLAVCRGFIEAQGGRIVAANRIDRAGAVVTIRLPLPAAATSGRLAADA
jgi:two-component system, OmpR family, sensor histidine kinase KdpD